MSIILNREEGNYRVNNLVLEYNHILQRPETCHLMHSQQKILSEQACQIDMADDCGISPKDAHELASKQVDGSSNLSYTRIDYKNYLRTKRQRNMMYGEAGSILGHF
jgi:hypothetical protein